MRIGINPVIDCVFKALFGTEENKALLLDLVNAILEENGEKKVVELQILNPYNPKTFFNDKLTIVDIKAKDENGEWFTIEMQLVVAKYYPKRLLYYWAKAYQSQLKEGEKYHLLKKVTLISISSEPLPIQTREYVNLFQLACRKKRELVLCDDLAIYTIELSKFIKEVNAIKTPIEKWIYFLKHAEDLDDENIPQQLEEPLMKQAVKELKKFTQDEIEREIYESRRMALMDEASKIYEAEQTGKEEGRKEGKEEGRKEGKEEGRKEMALNALKIGLDLPTIQKTTGLEIEKIKKIQQDMDKNS